MGNALAAARAGPGRPRKFDRPARPVTVTLPEDVLARLGSIDADLGRAIVSLVEHRRDRRSRPARDAEIATYGSHAVIVVTPVNALKRMPGVQLVPIGNGRALISLSHPHSIAQLELDVRDVLERGELTPVERKTLESLTDILRQARASRRVRLEERMIIVLEAKRRRSSQPD